MFYTINSSPMLVTKSVFKLIFVLSNYQMCIFPLKQLGSKGTPWRLSCLSNIHRQITDIVPNRPKNFLEVLFYQKYALRLYNSGNQRINIHCNGNLQERLCQGQSIINYFLNLFHIHTCRSFWLVSSLQSAIFYFLIVYGDRFLISDLEYQSCIDNFNKNSSWVNFLVVIFTRKSSDRAESSVY